MATLTYRPDDLADHKERVAEELVLLYLRLNGYLTIGGYLLHRSIGDVRGLRTEIDALAVRFPNQREPLHGGPHPEQQNDPELVLPREGNRIDFIVAEVKTGRGLPVFNRPLTRDDEESKRNLADILEMLGCFEERDELQDAATDLHEKLRKPNVPTPPTYVLRNGHAQVRLMLFWEPTPEEDGEKRFFVSLRHVLAFVEGRTRPEVACEPYSRWHAKWKGLTRRIMDAIDDRRTAGSVHESLEDLALHIRRRWDNELSGALLRCLL